MKFLRKRAAGCNETVQKTNAGVYLHRLSWSCVKDDTNIYNNFRTFKNEKSKITQQS